MPRLGRPSESRAPSPAGGQLTEGQGCIAMSSKSGRRPTYSEIAAELKQTRKEKEDLQREMEQTTPRIEAASRDIVANTAKLHTLTEMIEKYKDKVASDNLRYVNAVNALQESLTKYFYSVGKTISQQLLPGPAYDAAIATLSNAAPEMQSGIEYLSQCLLQRPENLRIVVHAAKDEHQAEGRVTQARAAASAKLASDPRQLAKAEALKLWRAWRAGNTKFKSGAAFHRYVCDRWPVITSTKTVERWCSKWVKEGKNRDAAG
jgi:hypothetical protein